MNQKPVIKAIIAAAGPGTRFLPQTKAMPKEMLPIIDKPVIQIIVEEAVHDVRRTAMAEIQRALSAERLRAERLAAEARRQGAEETLLALGRHSQAKEVRCIQFSYGKYQQVVI